MVSRNDTQRRTHLLTKLFVRGRSPFVLGGNSSNDTVGVVGGAGGLAVVADINTLSHRSRVKTSRKKIILLLSVSSLRFEVVTGAHPAAARPSCRSETLTTLPPCG